VTDLNKVGKDNLLKIIDESVLGGVNLVQVREKTLHQDELESLVLDIIEVVNGRAQIAVNSSVEASHISGVDFLHLPESQLDISTTNIDLFGFSVHSCESATLAQQKGAKYVIVGSIFSTESHPGGNPVGTDILCECNRRLSIPFCAIGGINASNAGGLIELGANGVAVISAILAAPDPRLAASELMTAMREKMEQ